MSGSALCVDTPAALAESWSRADTEVTFSLRQAVCYHCDLVIRKVDK